MPIETILLFMLSIGCDVSGQVFFKLGAHHEPGPGTHPVRAALTNKWLMAGLVTYGLESMVWLKILAAVPVSIAFPIASLNFLGVVLASRYLLKEHIEMRQWLGAGLVTLGVAVVASATQ